MRARARQLAILLISMVAAAGALPAQDEQDPELAVIWEIEGEGYCAYLPPEGGLTRFQFIDWHRWSSSATDPAFLGQL